MRSTAILCQADVHVGEGVILCDFDIEPLKI